MPEKPIQRRVLFLLSFLLLCPVWAGTGQAADGPWLQPSWNTDMTIPAGHYQGPGKLIPVGKNRIVWEPGSRVETLHANAAGEARLEATGCHFRNPTIGLTLWARLELTDCLVERPYFAKINPWYDTANPSTKWRFNNCVITDSFMGDKFTLVDCSVRAVNCTFVKVKMPVIHYRNGTVVNQARQDFLKFEKCRFVDCEINEEMLVSAVDCVFENCRYTRPNPRFPDQVEAPLEVEVWWGGNPQSSYAAGNLKVNFNTLRPTFRTGSSLVWSKAKDGWSMDGVKPDGPAVVLASQTPPPGPSPEPAEDTPAPAVAAGEVVKGTAGAAEVPLPKQKSAVNALLVVQLPGQGVAGAAARLSALTLPIAAGSSMEVKFNQAVGPMMMSSLREVVKCLQLKRKGWPQGLRVELSFEDKFVPKDGPSAAVACALLLDSMLGNWEIDPALAVTGDLNADGSVQPIGGVAGKIRGATRAGCVRVAVPAKNAGAVGDVLLLEGPEVLARIQVFGIATFEEARGLARLAPTTEMEDARQVFGDEAGTGSNLALAGLLFEDVRRALLPGNRWNANGLRDRAVLGKLKEIVRLQPNHLSAVQLLAVATRTAPGALTLQGSIGEMDDAAAGLLQAITGKEIAEMSKLAGDDLGDAVYKLRRLRPKMDARVRPAVDALIDFGDIMRTWQNNPPRSNTVATKLAASIISKAQEADRQRAKLMNDRKVVEELMQ